jgi:predicted dinucleotide-binding enzyme
MAPSPATSQAEEAASPSAAPEPVLSRRLGIVGAGKLGLALARGALAAGYEVAIAGSGPPERISLQVDVLAPGAAAKTVDGVVAFSELVVLAVPTHRFRELPADLFDGKILIDAMNYWPDIDGDIPELANAPGGTSAAVQAHFPGARVVKSLNQLGHHELDDYPREHGGPDRIAVAAASEDRLAVRAVMHLIDDLGFDPVDAGALENGRLLEPDGSPYAVTYTAAQLKQRLSET